MVTKETGDGSKTLYITRFLGEKGESIMSAMLHRSPESDAYEEGSVQYWEKLRDSFGAEQTL